MKAPSAATRRQLYLLAALGAVLVLALVRWGNRGSGSGTAPAPVHVASGAGAAGGGVANVEDDRSSARARPRASREKKVEAKDVPELDKKMLDPPRSRASADAGRNIFKLFVPTVPPPPTPTPPPPPPPRPGEAAFIGPLPPPGPTPTPVPPEIAFKFMGTFGPKDEPIAVLKSGDQLLNARTGDVVFGRFIVRSIGYESVDIAFVGYPPNVTRRLGITP